jgi:hypothetical protein
LHACTVPGTAEPGLMCTSPAACLPVAVWCDGTFDCDDAETLEEVEGGLCPFTCPVAAFDALRPALLTCGAHVYKAVGPLVTLQSAKSTEAELDALLGCADLLSCYATEFSGADDARFSACASSWKNNYLSLELTTIYFFKVAQACYAVTDHYRHTANPQTKTDLRRLRAFALECRGNESAPTGTVTCASQASEEASGSSSIRLSTAGIVIIVVTAGVIVLVAGLLSVSHYQQARLRRLVGAAGGVVQQQHRVIFQPTYSADGLPSYAQAVAPVGYSGAELPPPTTLATADTAFPAEPPAPGYLLIGFPQPPAAAGGPGPAA